MLWRQLFLILWRVFVEPTGPGKEVRHGDRFAGLVPAPHSTSRSPSSSGPAWQDAERFTSLDCLMSKAAWWCGNSHARGTCSHAEKTNNLQAKSHHGGYVPDFYIYIFFTISMHKQRCRTELFQNLSMKNISVPQGVNQQLQAGTDAH